MDRVASARVEEAEVYCSAPRMVLVPGDPSCMLLYQKIRAAPGPWSRGSRAWSQLQTLERGRFWLQTWSAAPGFSVWLQMSRGLWSRLQAAWSRLQSLEPGSRTLEPRAAGLRPSPLPRAVCWIRPRARSRGRLGGTVLHAALRARAPRAILQDLTSCSPPRVADGRDRDGRRGALVPTGRVQRYDDDAGEANHRSGQARARASRSRTRSCASAALRTLSPRLLLDASADSCAALRAPAPRRSPCADPTSCYTVPTPRRAPRPSSRPPCCSSACSRSSRPSASC